MPIFDPLGELLDVANNPFGASDKSEWNLVEGSFTSNETKQKCVFFVNTKGSTSGINSLMKTAVGKVTDTGGRRKVKYEYPYRDGQVVKDLGRKGETFNVEIVFYGPQYTTLFNRFTEVCVETKTSGILSHPVRGAVKGAFEDYEFVHSHDMWNAVAIRAVFIEDSSDALSALNGPNIAQNSALRSVLNVLATTQELITGALFTFGQLQKLPGSLVAAYTTRLDGIVSSSSVLLGKLAATFSTDSQLMSLAAQAVNQRVPITSLSSGLSSAGRVAPVFQVGLSSTEASVVSSQNTAFVSGNQVTPQQAVYLANQSRAEISAAITELQAELENDAFDMVLQYRTLAVEIQNTVEACIASAQSTVRFYTVPYAMSLRKAAWLNGLSPDRQNDLFSLNPNLSSANFVPEGTVLSVPTA